MIPTQTQVEYLWEKYHFPKEKRIHCQLVARVAQFISSQLKQKGIASNESLIVAAALLHDIDKNVPKRDGEEHPDAAVRVLRDEHLDEISTIVVTHPLHMILKPHTAPKTLEEKIVFLSDKMVKHEVMTVDKRFLLWNQEQISQEQKNILTNTYPLVKSLEQEIFSIIQLDPQDVVKYVK